MSRPFAAVWAPQTRVVAALLLGLGLLAPVPPAQAQDAARGAALLADAREAIGGADKVRAITRLQIDGVFRRTGGPMNMTVEGELTIAIALPGQFRRDETLSFGPGGPSVERTEVLNGTESWEKNSGGGRGMGFFMGRAGGGGPAGGPPPDRPQPTPEDLERLRALQLQNRRADVGRLLLALLLTTDAPVAWVGTAESPDGTADVLEIAPPGIPVTRLFLASESHMPLMLSWVAGAPRGGGGRRGAGRGTGPAGDQAPPPAGPPDGVGPRGGRAGGGFQPATFEMHFSEYKPVNGVSLPHLITRGINGETIEELEVSRYRVNPALKADTFTR